MRKQFAKSTLRALITGRVGNKIPVVFGGTQSSTDGKTIKVADLPDAADPMIRLTAEVHSYHEAEHVKVLRELRAVRGNGINVLGDMVNLSLLPHPKELHDLAKLVHNVLEDIRIDKRANNEFPGTTMKYRDAGQWHADRCTVAVLKKNDQLRRLVVNIKHECRNLYYKEALLDPVTYNRVAEDIPIFDKVLSGFVAEAHALETYDQVLGLGERIVNKLAEAMEPPEEEPPEEQPPEEEQPQPDEGDKDAPDETNETSPDSGTDPGDADSDDITDGTEQDSDDSEPEPEEPGSDGDGVPDKEDSPPDDTDTGTDSTGSDNPDSEPGEDSPDSTEPEGAEDSPADGSDPGEEDTEPGGGGDDGQDPPDSNDGGGEGGEPGGEDGSSSPGEDNPSGGGGEAPGDTEPEEPADGAPGGPEKPEEDVKGLLDPKAAEGVDASDVEGDKLGIINAEARGFYTTHPMAEDREVDSTNSTSSSRNWRKEGQEYLGGQESKIRQLLIADNAPKKVGSLRKGKRLDTHSLHKIRDIKFGKQPRVWSRTLQGRNIDTAVMISLDESGSMCGGQWTTCVRIVSALTHILDSVRIKYAVAGWSSLTAVGGGWSNEERRDNVIHRWYHRWNGRCKQGAFPDRPLDGSTPTATGMEKALEELGSRMEDRKVLFFFTDGQPNTRGVSPSAERAYLSEMVDRARSQGVACVGFGIDIGPGSTADIIMDNVFGEHWVPLPNFVEGEARQHAGKIMAKLKEALDE